MALFDKISGAVSQSNSFSGVQIHFQERKNMCTQESGALWVWGTQVEVGAMSNKLTQQHELAKLVNMYGQYGVYTVYDI